MSFKLGAHVDQPTRWPKRPTAAPTWCSSSSATRRATRRRARLRRRRGGTARAGGRGGRRSYVHAPYRLNVATTNNRIRIPSRKLLHQTLDAAAEIGAKGVIVHGGHVDDGDDPEAGFDNWRKCSSGPNCRSRCYREHGRRRQRDGPAPGPDRPAVGRGRRRLCERGFCLDTCHAHAGGRSCRHRRPGAGDHRPDRPGARQRLPGPVRLRGRPARELRRGPHRPGRHRRGGAGGRRPGVVETPTPITARRPTSTTSGRT